MVTEKEHPSTEVGGKVEENTSKDSKERKYLKREQGTYTGPQAPVQKLWFHIGFGLQIILNFRQLVKYIFPWTSRAAPPVQ